MRKFNKTLIPIMVVLMMLLATACTSTSAPAAAPTTAPASADTSAPAATGAAPTMDTSPITLSIWNAETTPGEQKTEIAQEIARITGVTMNVIQGDDQKFKLLLTGGDLPDIIYSNYTSQKVDQATLIQSGQIIPMDDLIAKWGVNINKTFPARLDYSKNILSNGTGKIYFLPVQCYKGDPNNPNVSVNGSQDGFLVRWDVYAKVGYPTINTPDDFLNVLKQMQDADPATPDGKKVYALAGWSDWGLYPWYVPNMIQSSVDMKVGWYDQETKKVSYMYNDSRFWDCISFYNKAYRMGIINPDAFTMKFQDYTDQVKAGQVLAITDSWEANNASDFAANGHPDWGFETLPNDGFPYIFYLAQPDSPIGFGADYDLAITKSCANPDRAMQFLDWMNSDQAARLVYSGVQGKHWDMVDGKPVQTQAFIDASKADSTYQTLTVGINVYNKLCGIQGTQVLSDGFPANVAMTNDNKAANITQVDKDYCAHYGTNYAFPGMVLADMLSKGQIKSFTTFDAVSYLAKPLSDTSKAASATIDDYMGQQIPKMIMAASDDEFNTLKQQALDAMKAKGSDGIEAELQTIYAQAAKDAAAFGN